LDRLAPGFDAVQLENLGATYRAETFEKIDDLLRRIKRAMDEAIINLGCRRLVIQKDKGGGCHVLYGLVLV
jgi:hypothetical protein